MQIFLETMENGKAVTKVEARHENSMTVQSTRDVNQKYCELCKHLQATNGSWQNINSIALARLSSNS